MVYLIQHARHYFGVTTAAFHRSRSLQTLWRIAEKVRVFVERHRMALLQYGLTTFVLGLFPRWKLLQVVVPGFLYTIFHPEVPYAPDFLISVAREEVSTSWLPDSEQGCEGNRSLEKRCVIIGRALEMLKLPGPHGWFMLGGASRTGKTEMMRIIAQRLVREEVPVFKLNRPQLGALPLTGVLDTRFVAIVAHLYAVAARTGKTPVVIMDEFHTAFSHGFSLGELLKSEMAGRGFNLLVATDQPEAVEQTEPALYNRMQGKAVVEPLDSEASKKVLRKVRFPCDVSAEAVDKAVEFAFVRGEVKGLNEAAALIEGAAHRIRAVGETTVNVQDIERQLYLREGATS